MVVRDVVYLFKQGNASSTIQSTMTLRTFISFWVWWIELVTSSSRSWCQTPSEPNPDVTFMPLWQDACSWSLVSSCQYVRVDWYTNNMLTAFPSISRTSPCIADTQQDTRLAVTLLSFVMNWWLFSSHTSTPNQQDVYLGYTKAITKVSLPSCTVRWGWEAHGPLFVLPGHVEPSPSWFILLLCDTVAAFVLSKYHITSHSFRIGHACDMAVAGYSSNEIHLAGWWCSDTYKN